MTARRATNPDGQMAAAFLAGLRDRVARDPAGKITLPTGADVDVADVAQVLRGIDRARGEDRHREGGR
jgi:hypothetical protein